MTGPPQPEPHPADEGSVGSSSLEPQPVEPKPLDAEPSEPRPVVMSDLGLWWLLALGLLVGLVFIATDHMWRAGASVAGSLWVAAGLRAWFPDERSGGLVVRRRWLDVTLLVLSGVLVALSAFTLDLRDLR